MYSFICRIGGQVAINLSAVNNKRIKPALVVCGIQWCLALFCCWLRYSSDMVGVCIVLQTLIWFFSSVGSNFYFISQDDAMLTGVIRMAILAINLIIILILIVTCVII